MLQQTAEQTDSYYAQFLLAKAYYDGKLTTKNDKKPLNGQEDPTKYREQKIIL